MPRVALIAAVARDGGLGKDNRLLWRLPEDLRHFKQATLGAPVLMGRRTWESIGRPLPGRRNIVVTRGSIDGVETAPSLPAALERLVDSAKVFVIGGAQLYSEALPLADELVLTEIDAQAEADTFFPAWDRTAFEGEATPWQRSSAGLDYRVVTWRRLQKDKPRSALR